MSWGISTSGVARTIGALSTLDIGVDDDAVYVVGPSVEYAIYVDQGTSRMEARPFVEPAAQRVQANLGELLGDDVLSAGGEALAKQAALAVEREMKRIITEKDAVDTGAMRASVTVERIQ